MSITIKGLEQLYKKLGNVAATKTLEPPMWRGVYRLQAAMQIVPPKPPESNYIRTNTYAKRWLARVKSASNGVTGTVGTNVPYAPYVGSRMFQTAAHRRTGWTTDDQAVQANEAAIVADFQSAVDRALAS
jgi:hypothetical protein